MYGLAARRATRLPAAAAPLKSAAAAPVWARFNSTASGGDAPGPAKAKRARKPKATPAQANAESSADKLAPSAAAPALVTSTLVEPVTWADIDKAVSKRMASTRAAKAAAAAQETTAASASAPSTSQPEAKAATTAEASAKSTPKAADTAAPTPAAPVSEVKAEKTTESKRHVQVSPPIPPRPTVTLKPYREVVADPEEAAYHADIVHGRASLKPYRHPAPYKVPVATIHFRSHFPRLLDLFTHFVEHAAAALAVPVGGTAKLPTRKTLWTVIRGPFVHKKSQENFERRVHKRAITAYDTDPEVLDRWLMYLKKHSMAGVGMRISRWHRVPVGIGRHQLEAVAGRMKFGKVPPRDQILQLGQQVIAEETKAATEVKPEDEQVVKA
ncbi:unnamed protein product [Peniophora sp. CBMAI 1063]|nr:unnamed protein product [Peniophora sp. CBMAI 1063]